MFPAWQCRHIRGSLDSSSSSFSSANSLFFSRARTWKIPLYSWLPFFHSSSVQSIVSRLAFIDHPTSLVQTCRDSIAFRLRELPPPTCANDRSRSTRSRPDSRLSNNPRSLFPIHDSSIRPLSPRSCLPPVFPFTKLKYPNDYSVRIYIYIEGNIERKKSPTMFLPRIHRWTAKQRVHYLLNSCWTNNAIHVRSNNSISVPYFSSR